MHTGAEPGGSVFRDRVVGVARSALVADYFAGLLGLIADLPGRMRGSALHLSGRLPNGVLYLVDAGHRRLFDLLGCFLSGRLQIGHHHLSYLPRLAGQRLGRLWTP
jgi:hypothetical protein